MMEAKEKTIARKAVPQAPFEGVLDIGGILIPCAVLEDGTRLLPQQGVLTAIGRSRAAKGGEGVQADGKPAFLRPSNIQPYIPEDLSSSTGYILYQTKYWIKA